MDEIQLSALKYIVSYAYEHTLFYKKLYNNIDISCCLLSKNCLL